MAIKEGDIGRYHEKEVIAKFDLHDLRGMLVSGHLLSNSSLKEVVTSRYWAQMVCWCPLDSSTELKNQ